MRKHKVLICVGIVLLMVLTAVYYGMCKIASTKALEIFNREIAKQEVLKGTITVKDIQADMFGNVVLQYLVWLDTEGEPIVDGHDVRIKVSPWDVITKSINTSSIQEIELHDTFVALKFNEKMQVDFIRPVKNKPVPDTPPIKPPALSQEGKEQAAAIPKQPQAAQPEKKQPQIKENKPAMTGRIKALENFSMGDKRFQVKLILKNCKFEAVYPKRYFVLNEVNAVVELNTRKALKIDFSTGKFGGTMIGEGLTIKGGLDFTKKIPVYDMTLFLDEVLPTSLGIGVKLDDKVSITAKIKGELPSPIIDGDLSFKELVIPGLRFSDVKGEVFYKDAAMDFKNVTARSFGGDVEAHGDYDLNSRRYNIYVKGHKLRSDIATKDIAFKCLVELDLSMLCDGNPKNTLTFGSFSSSKGNYHLIPFDKIEGTFSNQYGVLEFKDVVITTMLGEVFTDALRLEKGKVSVGDIFFKDKDTGKYMKVRKKK